MITKAQVKHIHLLSDKNYRKDHGEFIIEGIKMVDEAMINGIPLKQVMATEEWFALNSEKLSNGIIQIVLHEGELNKISSFKTPQPVMAIVDMPKYTTETHSGVALVLDAVQDPGNMGSIMRIADWFGINTIYATVECADTFNSKVLQASMGSVFRIQVLQRDIEFIYLLIQANIGYAATLHGESIYSHPKIEEGLILLGNESKGIREQFLKVCQHHITIPKKGSAESLNAAVAAGIICSHLLS